MKPADPPESDEGRERAVPRDLLRTLPLGYQTIWEKPLLPRAVLQAMTLENTKWRSSHVVKACDKPLSKIVESPEESQFWTWRTPDRSI
jgi:hypothetical protein